MTKPSELPESISDAGRPKSEGFSMFGSLKKRLSKRGRIPQNPASPPQHPPSLPQYQPSPSQYPPFPHQNPFHRRPAVSRDSKEQTHVPSERPPEYSYPPASLPPPHASRSDDEYAFLKSFDTIFLIDDSASSFIPKRGISDVGQERVGRRIPGLKGTKGFIGQNSVIALCDTGAQDNFISEKVAKTLRLKMRRIYGGTRPRFVQGNGAVVRAIGSVNTKWAFQTDRGCPPIDIHFHVLKDCIFDIMIGSDFLSQTNTMTEHRERLCSMPRPQNGHNGRVRHVNLCGTPSQRIRGRIESKECSALPDSGAEPNLLSYEYAKRRGWLSSMFEGPEDCQLLQFADGSIEKVDGRLRLSWDFLAQELSPASGVLGIHVDFDVLRGCPHDVILGSDFLDSTDTFMDHMNSFQEVVQDSLSGLNVVVWAKAKLEKMRNKTKTADQINQERLDQEQEDRLESKGQAECESIRQRHYSLSPTPLMTSGGISSTPAVNNASQANHTQHGVCPTTTPTIGGSLGTSNPTGQGTTQSQVHSNAHPAPPAPTSTPQIHPE